jgi:hypothetical protein
MGGADSRKIGRTEASGIIGEIAFPWRTSFALEELKVPRFARGDDAPPRRIVV